MEGKLTITKASDSDVNTLFHLAERIWWPTYSNLLSKEQIELMLDDMYKPNAVLAQMDLGISYAIAKMNAKSIGFIAFGPKAVDPTVYRIEKLYLLPETQGAGFGRKLIEYVEALAKEKRMAALELNINRNNPALAFYKKLGFSITEKIDLPYHHFVLNDYVMRKKIEYDS